MKAKAKSEQIKAKAGVVKSLKAEVKTKDSKIKELEKKYARFRARSPGHSLSKPFAAAEKDPKKVEEFLLAFAQHIEDTSASNTKSRAPVRSEGPLRS